MELRAIFFSCCRYLLRIISPVSFLAHNLSSETSAVTAFSSSPEASFGLESKGAVVDATIWRFLQYLQIH